MRGVNWEGGVGGALHEAGGGGDVTGAGPALQSPLSSEDQGSGRGLFYSLVGLELRLEKV